MNGIRDGQEINHRFLEAALAWLRLRLERLAGSAGRGPSESSGWWHSWMRACPATCRGVTDADIERSAAALTAALSTTGDAPAAIQRPPMVDLAAAFGLTPFERDILLLCTAMELDPDLADLCAAAQRNQNRPFPTFGLALMLFDEPHWSALSAERPLRYWRLLEIHQPGAQTLIASPLRADERIVNYLAGWNCLDDRLTGMLMPLEPFLDALSVSQAEAARRIVWSARPDELGVRPLLVQLLGPDGESKHLVARQAATQLNLSLLHLAGQHLPGQPAELTAFIRLWQRESRLLPLALYVDAHDLDGAPADRGAALDQLLMRTQDCLVFLGAREPREIAGRPNLALDVSRPTPVEQKKEWVRVLGQHAGDIPGRMAGQFNLDLPVIRGIVKKEQEQTANGHLRDRLWKTCLAHTRPRLDALAQRLEVKASRADLVLPRPESDLLEQIAGQVWNRSTVYDDWGFRHSSGRGLGLSVLFAGESGTGKTLAAEVLANHLHLNLYRIDLSAVVSKYIGETEKNLRRLFDAAEDGGAILFFDEADALFGKRSEVKDSHDRFANIEINYLLQRIEAYRGLAILATNMKSALDPAFVRRLRFIVNFPFPGPPERERIWREVFPKSDPLRQLQGVPVELSGEDYQRLARLALTGASIRTISMNAAFLAAGSDPPLVTLKTVFEAARTEFRKLGKDIPRDFQEGSATPRLLGANR